MSAAALAASGRATCTGPLDGAITFDVSLTLHDGCDASDGVPVEATIAASVVGAIITIDNVDALAADGDGWSNAGADLCAALAADPTVRAAVRLLVAPLAARIDRAREAA